MKNFKLRMPGDKVCNRRVLEHMAKLRIHWSSGKEIIPDDDIKDHMYFLFIKDRRLTFGNYYDEKYFFNNSLPEITLAEFFALKPEPVFPMTFDDCPGANFYYDSVSFSVSISGCSYEMLDKAVKHADEIRGTLK